VQANSQRSVEDDALGQEMFNCKRKFKVMLSEHGWEGTG